MTLTTSPASFIAKQISYESLDEDARLVLRFALPGFFADPMEGHAAKFARNRGTVDREELERFVRDVGGANRRRFSPAGLLPRGRYYSIANAQDGADHGTMRNEMSAYRDARLSGYVHLLDCASTDYSESIAYFEVDNDGTQFAKVYMGSPLAAFDNQLLLLLYDRERFEEFCRNESVTFDFAKHAAKERWDYYLNERMVVVPKGNFRLSPFLHMTIPWTLRMVELQRVLDFRTPQALTWLQHFIRDRADLDVSQEEGKPEFILSLLDPRIGGNRLTAEIGMLAVQSGVEGIIYPSARSNVKVSWDGGEVSGSAGWNFLDLREGEGFQHQETIERLEALRTHHTFQAWLDHESEEDRWLRSRFAHIVRVRPHPEGGFHASNVEEMHLEAYVNDLVNVRGKWFGTEPHSADGLRNWEAFRLLMEIVEWKSENRWIMHFWDLMLAANAHLRPMEIDCIRCGIVLDAGRMKFVPGSLLMEVAESSHLVERASGKERLNQLARHEARLKRQPSPFLVCTACARLCEEHLDVEVSSELVARYVSGGEIPDELIVKLDRRAPAGPLKNWFEETPQMLIDLPSYFKRHLTAVTSSAESMFERMQKA